MRKTGPDRVRGLDEQLASGDPEVVSALLEAFGAAIQRRLARRYRGVLRPGEIEDVLMIAVERLWIRRECFDPSRGSLGGWLGRIAEHVAADIVRTPWCQARLQERQVESTRLLALEAPGGDYVSEGDAAASTTCRAAVEALRAALDRLPAGQRRILLADAVAAGGTARSESLGAELGITASAVRSRRQRGLARLRRELPQPGSRRAHR